MRKKLKTICLMVTVLSLVFGSTGFASAMPNSNSMQTEMEFGEGLSGQDAETEPGQEETKQDTKTESDEEKAGQDTKTESGKEETKQDVETATKEESSETDTETGDGSEETSVSSGFLKQILEETMNYAESEDAQSQELLAEEDSLSGVYYEWQSLEEILALCEEGLDLADFFQYTIWGFLTVEDIQGLVDNGHTLDDVYEALETGTTNISEDIQKVLDAYAAVPMLLSIGDTRVAGFNGRLSSDLGVIPAFGNIQHGSMSRIHLSGETAFCAKYGAPCRTGMVYTSVPLSEIGIDSGKERTIRGLLAHYAEAQSIYNGPTNYMMAQASVWLVVNNNWSGNADQMAAAIAPLFTKVPDAPSAESVTDYFKSIVEWVNEPGHEAQIEAVGLEAWANGPNQYLITATGEGGSLEELGPYAHIELKKTDSETGNVIADETQFTIYEWNGGSYEPCDVSVFRDGDIYISDDLFRTNENEGRFYVEESLAPHTGTTTGYYGDFEGSSKRRHLFEVEEGMKGDAIQITNHGSTFENQRTTGSIKVFKTDIEADAYITGDVSHGTAVLDGAVYDLYAEEPIIHPDGVTGILFAKDQLVASGTIKDGTCIFENLYLGKYYIKERQKGATLADGKKLSYAKGYLLDEAIYHVALTYEGEAVADVHREVHSNKEQAIKAKAVFEKVESASGQGNINYLEGAGFTIYRIDKLSRQDSFIRNADGTFDEKSIQAAYLVKDYNQDIPKYDFSGEDAAVATLYIRNTSMRSDTQFYWQDGNADLKAGKLIPLGGSYYRVAELFSDENGQLVTPYLSYGQYLAVETTVPKDHFMAPPFVLTFNRGKTTNVITTGVTEHTPYGKNLLKSPGDAVRSCEAVYFSKVIDNEAIEELLKIYKKDTDTGKTVLLADTKFKIAKIQEETGDKTYLTHTSYYPNTVNRDIFCTNAEGYLQLPELLPAGIYQIEEVDGPNGFYNDISAGYVKFRVTTDREYLSLLGGGPDGSTLEGDLGNRDVILIMEDYYNRETRGGLTIKKQGEVLTDYKNTSLLQSIREFFGQNPKKQFIYEKQPLAHAEYTIRAAEDIVTQDRQLDEKGNRTLWFKQGDVVAVISTGEDGQIDETKTVTDAYPDGHSIVTIIHDGTLGSVKVYLPLGSYEIEETKAPYGYTKTEETWKVTFTWEHQFQEFVFNSEPIETTDHGSYAEETGTLTVTNARVKAVPENQVTVPGIGIYKRSKGNNVPLPDVTFGLYSTDDIYTREGVKLAEAGELLSICTTGADGKGIFDVDVPIRDEFYGEKENTNSGAYEIRELETPNGILLDSTPTQILFTYVDDETEYVVIAKEQQNAASEVYVSKQDIANGAELKGAALIVKEEKGGTVVQSWISDGSRKEIRGLDLNDDVNDNTYIYVLKETAAPNGYLIANEIRFKLVKEEAEDGELKNSVYVYDTSQKVWCLAENNTVIMKDEADEVPKVPETPDTPEPSSPKSSHHHNPKPLSAPEVLLAPITGDHAPVALLLFLLLAAGITGGILYYIHRKKS